MSKRTPKSAAKPPRKRYQDMTTDELREATRQYDVPAIKPSGRPLRGNMAARHKRAIEAARRAQASGKPVSNALPPAEKVRIEQMAHEARAKIGRPVVGQGATSVLVSIERGLLTDADRYAEEQGMSRSELIAAGLRKIIKGRRRSA
jgi:hypothetical protein